MSIPAVYSVEIANRANTILNSYAEAKQGPSYQATILVTLAYPLIINSLERFNLQGHGQSASSFNKEANIPEQLAEQFKKTKFETTVFLSDKIEWKYKKIKYDSKLSFPDYIPRLELNCDNPFCGETNMFLAILRNSFSHGGIYYLNESFESKSEDEAKYILFVSEKRAAEPKCETCNNKVMNIVSINCLWISIDGFSEFLKEWIKLMD